MKLRFACLIVAAFALGSCSYAYKIRAVVIDGRLAFVVNPSSSAHPTCINAITVSVDDAERVAAKAAAGDDVQLVWNGVFWSQTLKHDCQNRFPIVYGQPLKGERLVHGNGVPAPYQGQESSFVGAKPLHVGLIYEVNTTSGATGFGRGWFRISSDRRLENLSDDPSPPRLTDPADHSD